MFIVYIYIHILWHGHLGLPDHVQPLGEKMWPQPRINFQTGGQVSIGGGGVVDVWALLHGFSVKQPSVNALVFSVRASSFT